MPQPPTHTPPHHRSECAHIHQANLLEIVDLGRTFKGAGIRNLSQMSSTTSGESIAYNKLLGHQDGIIADIVRREGLVSAYGHRQAHTHVRVYRCV